jgi:hypothetical protein
MKITLNTENDRDTLLALLHDFRIALQTTRAYHKYRALNPADASRRDWELDDALAAATAGNLIDIHIMQVHRAACPFEIDLKWRAM